MDLMILDVFSSLNDSLILPISVWCLQLYSHSAHEGFVNYVSDKLILILEENVNYSLVYSQLQHCLQTSSITHK